MAHTKTKMNILDAIGISFESKEKQGKYCLKYLEKYPHKGGQLPSDFVKYFIQDPVHFQEKKRSKKDDWMACHKESGQTFDRWMTSYSPIPNHRQSTVYLLPLVFVEDPVPQEILEPLKDFAQIFFQIPVKLMKVTKIATKNRINEYSKTYQVDAGQILEAMKPLIPSDAFCVAGITMCDLFPRESWNFVFGLANLAGKCGVYSLARYLTNFGKTQTTVYDPSSEEHGKSTIIRRACKTMCHEICHMFGLKHCVFYECLMNGSNHLEESDARPTFLCPVCLRKMQFSCKFNIEDRYQQMHQFWISHGLKEEADWLQSRLQTLKDKETEQT